MSQSEPRLQSDALSGRLAYGPPTGASACSATPPKNSLKPSQTVSRLTGVAGKKNKVSPKAAKSRQEPPNWGASSFRRFAFAISASLLLIASPFVRADDESLKHALALESTIEQIVQKAESSVACILVSRSDAYQNVKMFRELQMHRPSGRPGDLGDFQAPARQPRFGNITPEQELLKKLDLAAPEAVPDSYGSGVVIDSSAEIKILTYYHVVRDAKKIFVRLPGTHGSYANIIAADERSDLAVLQLIERLQNVKALTMGDADDVKKGQFVISIANPYAAGFRDGSPSVSWGMLSNIRRRLPGEPNEGDKRRPRLHYYPVLLQTDMRFPMGCSGGALLDLHGRWIGLTTSIAGVVGGDGAGGYAVPLDTRMKRIIEKLRQGLEVEYGFLGIVQDANGSFGWSPTPGGPAEKAGMQAGDTIVKIDDISVEHDQDNLLFSVTSALAGTRIHMLVRSNFTMRERVLRPVLVKADWPTTEPVIALNRPALVFGMRVDYTSVMIIPQSERRRVDPGVVVREVAENSPAAKAGFLPEHTVITRVNGVPVTTPGEFYQATAGKETIELTLLDGNTVRLP